jgi:nucleoside-diphosphate-sugar epimerase
VKLSDYTKILITGAPGWLGSRLVSSAVKTGLPVRCFVCCDQDVTPLLKISRDIEIVFGDVRNPADCDRFCAPARGSVLFHVAGVIHPKRVRDFYAINLDGTVNIMDAAIRSYVRRFIVLSSNSPFGCNPFPSHRFFENSPCNPYLNYGKSKMDMERNVKIRSWDIETVTIRPTWFYGPGQPLRQTRFFLMVRNGQFPIIGGGENVRSMTYVDSLCDALMLAAQSADAIGECYWIADKRPYSMNEIVDTVERLLETEFGKQCAHKRVHLPNVVSNAAYCADWILQSIGLYNQEIHVLSEMNKTIACSVGKAERELGYKPATSLEEGMRQSIKWCIDQGIEI